MSWRWRRFSEENASLWRTERELFDMSRTWRYLVDRCEVTRPHLGVAVDKTGQLSEGPAPADHRLLPLPPHAGAGPGTGGSCWGGQAHQEQHHQP